MEMTGWNVAMVGVVVLSVVLCGAVSVRVVC